MPIRDLPRNPSNEHLRQQARTLQRQVRAGAAGAQATVREFHPRPDALADQARFPLADAQLVVARQYGFASWPKLRRHVDVLTRYARSPHLPAPADSDDPADRFLRLACLAYGGDRPGRRQEARRLLTEHPELATASIHTMAAVGEVAAATALLAEDPTQASCWRTGSAAGLAGRGGPGPAMPSPPRPSCSRTSCCERPGTICRSWPG